MRRRRPASGRSVAGPAKAIRPAASTTSRPSGSWRVPPRRAASAAGRGARTGGRVGQVHARTGYAATWHAPGPERAAGRGPGRSIGRRARRAQRFLPRTSKRWAVHSEPPRSIVRRAAVPAAGAGDRLRLVLVLVDHVLERLDGRGGLDGRATVHRDSCIGGPCRKVAMRGVPIMPETGQNPLDRGSTAQSPAGSRSSRSTSVDRDRVWHEAERPRGTRSTPASRRGRSRRGPFGLQRAASTCRSSRRGSRACVSRSLPSSGTAAIAASSPTSGSALISSIARSVAATNAAIASRFVVERRRPGDEPGPGSGVIVVDAQDDRRRARRARAGPARCWRSRSRRRPRPAATAAPWPKSGYSTISTSSGVRPADSSSAWSMIQRRAVLARECRSSCP